jgi:hypothetical protein
VSQKVTRRPQCDRSGSEDTTQVEVAGKREGHMVGGDRWERGNGKKVGQNGAEWKTHGGRW